MKSLSVEKVFRATKDIMDKKTKKIALIWHRNMYKHEHPKPQGGEISSKIILTYLSKFYKVAAIVATGKPSRYKHGSVEVYETMKNDVAIKRAIEDFNPDILLTNGTLSPIVNNLAKELLIPFVIFVRFWWCFGFTDHLTLKNILQGSGGPQLITFKEAFNNAKAVIGNCDYVTKCIKKFFNRQDADTALSPVLKNNVIAEERNPKYISVLNYKPELTCDSVEKLAKLLPKEKFLLVSNNIEKEIQRGNITEIPRVEYDKMKYLYSVTKILLYPSYIDAAGHGRVCYEAAYNGIPIITNGVGGLVEFVKDAGIVIRCDAKPKHLHKAIVKISRNYDGYVKMVKKRMEKYYVIDELKKVKDIIER